MSSVYKALKEVIGYEFQNICIRKLNNGEKQYCYYVVTCKFLESFHADELVVDDSKGMIKRYRNANAAIGAAEKILANNFVRNNVIQLQLN